MIYEISSISFTSASRYQRILKVVLGTNSTPFSERTAIKQASSARERFIYFCAR